MSEAKARVSNPLDPLNPPYCFYGVLSPLVGARKVVASVDSAWDASRYNMDPSEAVRD